MRQVHSTQVSSCKAFENDISHIDSSTHLFFDDKHNYIMDVSNSATAAGLPLVAIECPPCEVVLYDETGHKIKTVAEKFSSIKSRGFEGEFGNFLREHNTETEVGNGITIPMIQQIIEFEDLPTNPKERIYFFDCDKLLSYIRSVSFEFGVFAPEGDISKLIPAYAKYVFSDHIGPEPPNGRLMLLRKMFEKIGADRVYIITSNYMANDQILNDETNTFGPNPDKKHFVELMRELLPSFDETHITCTFYENQSPPLFNHKGEAIVHILTERMLAKQH